MMELPVRRDGHSTDGYSSNSALAIERPYWDLEGSCAKLGSSYSSFTILINLNKQFWIFKKLLKLEQITETPSLFT